MKKSSFWEKLVVGLDDDERIIFPEMYEKSRRLYDKLIGVAYLVRSKENPEAGLDWVWQNSLSRIKNEVDVLAKQYVVRIRLPWNEVRTEWLCSQEELDEHREDYEVIDVYLKVRLKDDPNSLPIMDPLEFESNRDKYDVVEARYLVAWKLNPEEQARFLGIDMDTFHTVISE